MPNVLTKLRLKEVSLVDRGAGEGVKVMLYKRALSEEHPGGKDPRSGNKKLRRPKTLFEHQQRARAEYDLPTGNARSARGVSPETGDKSRHGRQRHLKGMTMQLSPKVEKYLARNIFLQAGIAKRDVSSKERERLAAEGHAMSGGGYPIANVKDLKNAIRAIGRAKNPGKTRSHIRRQAARLGRTDLIPDGWKGVGKVRKPAFAGAAPPFGGKKPPKKTAKALVKIAGDLAAVRNLLKGSVSFDQMMAEMSSMDYAEGLVEAIRDATHAIKDSIESIADCDDMMPNEKATAIAESLDQFKDHIAGIAPGNITKALKEGLGLMTKLQKKLLKTYTSVPGHDATPPTKDKDTKIDPDADEDVTAGIDAAKAAKKADKLRKKLKKQEKLLKQLDGRSTAALQLSKAEKDYVEQAGNDMDEDDKKKFLDLSTKKRAAYMKAHPIAELAKRHLAGLPEPLRKQLEEGAVATAQVAKMTEEREIADFAKRATELGQPAAFGEHLRRLEKGIGTPEERQKALAEVTRVMKAGSEQSRMAGLFSEFGTANGATGTAWDQLMAKAAEVRNEVNKTAGAKPLTPEQAFAKVYEDPANATLVKQYNEERRRAA